jgi:hypothetical protein
MSTKSSLLLILLLGTVLVGVVTVGIYYAQPFSETMTFKDTIPYSSLSIQSHFESYSNTYVFDGADAELGSLILHNTGSFSHTYKLPLFIGCVHFPQKGYQQAQISLTSPNDTTTYKQYGYPSYSSIFERTLEPNQEITYVIHGVYNSYGLLEKFMEDKPDSISVYKINQNENWYLLDLLGFNENSYALYSAQCNQLGDSAKLLKTIPITR